MSGPPRDVAVIGAGAWGLALAVQAQRAGRRVTLWARDPRRIGRRLPGTTLPADILRTGTLPSAPLVLLAVPVPHLRAVAAALPPGGPIICCAKGIEAATLALPLELLAEAQPGRPAGVLTGPNFAREIAVGLPAAAVLAAAPSGSGARRSPPSPRPPSASTATRT